MVWRNAIGKQSRDPSMAMGGQHAGLVPPPLMTMQSSLSLSKNEFLTSYFGESWTEIEDID